MSPEYLNDAIVSVSPAASPFEGWTYFRIELNTSIVLASGCVVTYLEVLLDENGAAFLRARPLPAVTCESDC